MRRLAVYCGASMGADPAYAAAADALGAAIAERGIGLVYGGGRLGLMGVVADSALRHGGEAHGVIPQALVDLEAAHRGLTELHVVTTMHERKAKMTELCDAFVALPGGIGTLDELFEAWTWNALGYHAKPFALLDVGGFWRGLTGFLDTVAESGFMSGPRRAQLLYAEGVDEALDLLTDATARAERKVVL
ncbi:MAG: Lysine decarboxylase family [uncultured Sphingomonadaceae bacterium]|uniref:Cytokinin riboside 5'-monophosphate phosphoribohydrolase n=1 Tax=uncultured Sphingomonadaceae bacterium TaxID=169976 RepID=A0A6J4RTT2_9SPHN|nr:MAG: Lysine decarboxylase family [uncultured Sphingomonadaceae bacterium]